MSKAIEAAARVIQTEFNAIDYPGISMEKATEIALKAIRAYRETRRPDTRQLAPLKAPGFDPAG